MSSWVRLKRERDRVFVLKEREYSHALNNDGSDDSIFNENASSKQKNLLDINQFLSWSF